MGWNEEIRTLLKQARNDAGLSARKLGEFIQRDGRTIRRIETGDSGLPDGAIIDKWLMVCQVRIKVELEPRW